MRWEGKVSICSPVEASSGLLRRLSSVCLSVEQRRSWVKKRGGSLCQAGMRGRIYKVSREEAASGAALPSGTLHEGRACFWMKDEPFC